MNVLFELLFNAWCAPYDPARFPEHLRADPVRAYGQYAFQAASGWLWGWPCPA